MSAREKFGFTLIELLIVIAIIGILASIILINISSSRDRALIASYKSTMFSLRNAMQMCVNDATLYTGTRAPESAICNSSDSPTYPPLPKECGNMSYVITANGYNWTVTTDTSCGGCRLVCDLDDCTEVGECYL